MLDEWLTEPPDSSALTIRRCCGAVAGILPVAGSTPRLCARPSALSADSRREGVVAADAEVGAVPAGAGIGVGGLGAGAGAGAAASEARNSSMFLTSGSAADLEAT